MRVRSLLGVLLIGTIAGVAGAQGLISRPEPTRPAPPPPPPPAKLLGIGDDAPRLSISDWVRGEPVTAIEKGRIYVLSFFSPGAGVSVNEVPHLTRIQQKYADKGVVVIAIGEPEPNTNLDTIKAFADLHAGTIGFRFGYDATKESREDWMEKADIPALPITFIVGKDARIAYFGISTVCDEVLDAMLAGTWKGRDSVAAMRDIEVEFNDIIRASDHQPQNSLDQVRAYEAKYPMRKDFIAQRKLMLAMKIKDWDSARQIARERIDTCLARHESGYLRDLTYTLCNPQFNPEHKLADLAIESASHASDLMHAKDHLALAALAMAYEASGDHDKAIDFFHKAREATSDEHFQRQYDALAERIAKTPSPDAPKPAPATNSPADPKK